ncbi:MAG: type II toxin-antitoxin system ParD family antitoxin [bacterium]|nr:type II toxin-antitoxin system ParD family antitoxin [bacterium]
MSTLSVPLTPELEVFIKAQVKSGRAANKADVVRRALRAMSEEEAVEAVLRAAREPTLRGNLRELMKKID